MATKTFSSRADTDLLSYAEALTQKELGMSFGQYCGSVLLESIEQTGVIPAATMQAPSKKKQDAALYIKSFSGRKTNPVVGRMSDAEIKNLIAAKYE